MLNFYVIDTETNGLKAKYHEINEISIIRCTDRVQLTEYIKTENPERSNTQALAITHKTYDDLKRGLSKEAAVEKINKFILEDGVSPAHRCIIGHNIQFDRKFIHALYESVGLEFPANLWLDTMSLAKAYAKQMRFDKKR